MDVCKKFKLVLDSMMSFSYAPIRFMTFIGVIFDIFALVLLISVLAEYFTKGVPILGWSSLMCVILLASVLILSMLGILGEYVWRALDASRARPPFIIDEEKVSGHHQKKHKNKMRKNDGSISSGKTVSRAEFDEK